LKKKILVIAITLMFVAMLATPVIASSPNRIEITFDHGPYFEEESDWEKKGNVVHGRNGLMWWEDCVITGEGINLVGGTNYKTYSYDINVKNSPPHPMRWLGNGVLHYEAEVVFDDGTFTGNHILSGEFRVRKSDGWVRPWNTRGYGVYHGTGAYLGWIWVTSDITTEGDAVFESYMLIPKPKLP